MQSNPAKAIKAPVVKQKPTLPFSDEQMEKIHMGDRTLPRKASIQSRQHTTEAKGVHPRHALFGPENLGRCHPKARPDQGRQTFFVRHKTNVPVWIPLPKVVVEALDACDKGGEFYFYTGTAR